MNWLTIISGALFWLFLIVLTWLIYRIWRTSEKRTEHVSRMESMTADVMRANAESARQSAESARSCVEMIHNFMALQAKGPESRE